MLTRPRLLAIAVTVTLTSLVGCGSSKTPNVTSDTAAGSSAATVAPDQSGTSTVASASSSCHTLGPGQSLVATAAQVGDLAVYAKPDDPAPARTMANPRLINNDPNLKVPLVFLVKGFSDDTQCAWTEVYLPQRPNGSTGWVRATDLQFATNDYRLEVSLDGFSLKLFKDDKQIDDIKIGVAKDNTPTPGGLYYTTELEQPPDPNGDYGPYAFGLSGFSDTLTSFNGGPGQLGIHGTNQPQAIGTKVSHGCIRMSNADITKLARLLPLGTPVQITA